MRAIVTQRLIASLQSAIAARASARSRDWWTRYLKGAIEFRGVGVPLIREVIHQWRADSGLAAEPADRQFAIAIELLRQPIAEDKLAGIIYLQEYLNEVVDWRDAIPKYQRLFDDGFIHEWSTCDWFCVRVLGPTIASNGMACARAVAAWHKADNLWRARASAVGFVYLVKDRRFHPLIERSCVTLIQRDERFAKTAVGWTMREVSRHDPDRVARFVEKYRKHFSTESFNAATAKLPDFRSQ